MKNAWKHCLTAVCVLLLSACSEDQTNMRTLRLGVSAGPEAEVAHYAQDNVAASYGLNLHPVVFNNYNAVNVALCEGTIDADIFQPLPLLNEQIEHDKNLQQVMQRTRCELVPIAKTFIYPMGLYSRSITSLNQLPQQAVVAVPNEPVSITRALLLLQKQGLIKLRAGANHYATTDDIVSNPRQLVIVTINPAALPETIGSASLVAISSSYAALGGLALKDALAIESSSDYALLIVVRKEDAEDLEFAQLVALYHSSEMITEVKDVSNGAAIPAWKKNE